MFKKMQKKLILGIACLLSAQGAVAWTPSGELSKVVRLYMFEETSPLTVIQLESGLFCYVPHSAGENKKVINLLLALSISEKKAEFYCHDLTETISGGFPAHKLHRISPI